VNYLLFIHEACNEEYGVLSITNFHKTWYKLCNTGEFSKFLLKKEAVVSSEILVCSYQTTRNLGDRQRDWRVWRGAGGVDCRGIEHCYWWSDRECSYYRHNETTKHFG